MKRSREDELFYFLSFKWIVACRRTGSDGEFLILNKAISIGVFDIMILFQAYMSNYVFKGTFSFLG